ncbi:hypothetical protein EMIHUDRAFT_246741 [Emiliania huxleyi CCMP1516]|nr:hypothetical protein EMIHUDRAFT_246741 [Emiliania huxleyi CCMP1516]EOD13643.1 hypothetical protein EMIHUDRAFT_246741 [Emiliania huxleyi CCMP1516]|eukprot:XP_005766072.1 hypothetical protein EMIHUDRAFT_246741 [Emiliania huxleyi CCMP1516]
MGCTTVSELQCAVGRTLHESCDDFESEIIDPQTLYSLDFASRAMRIAVEAAPAVDGPTHFCCSLDLLGQQVPSGPTLLKRRQLMAAGWRVINVPYFEWHRLEGPRERRRYIESRVRYAMDAAPQPGIVATAAR